ncbi:SHOCT domain-containing protein [Methylobacterium iners]|uniref:SHOCT domain-containing protein n=1 Tax=Methylobacterium iners TaxID=418707 RepID=A0ABQ4RXL2_9HYPH|nr:SHOCT domain-containing protein [Methylobacterium iners]GJD95125.1 hypothetical protein OCOJLMKI_2334 [Methylobacterium iners]
MTDEDPDRPAAGLRAVADRHGVSLEAVRHLLRALEAGHGTMAQFDHPDLGGFGQWSAGGMIMIGQMFDSGLKARVAALCDELSRSLPVAAWGEARGGGWWPPELGQPATSGAQNAMRYAYFPRHRRLAVEIDGRLAVYDTGEHEISGVSQAQGGGQSLRFTGRGGAVDLAALTQLDGSGPAVAPVPAEPSRPSPPSMPSPPADVPTPPTVQGDILSTLERLAELHRKGVLTEQEFTAKKAELLARL